MSDPRDIGPGTGPTQKDPAGPESAGRDEDPGVEVLFDAVVWPHRSLSPRGFAILMATIGGLSFVAGMAFISAGAWPVFGFLGLDVALVYVAFRLNYRQARALERVVLTRDALTIRRIDHRGRTAEVAIQPYWLRVEIAGGEQAEQIRLRTHGEVHVVGDWLSPPERESFADALRDALDRLRAPPPVAGAVGSTGR